MPVPFGVKERKGKSEAEDRVCNAKRTRVKWNLKIVNRTQWTHPSTPDFNCITDTTKAAEKDWIVVDEYSHKIFLLIFFQLKWITFGT